MSQESDDRRTPSAAVPPAVQPDHSGRRPYEPPQLIEYGDIATLTQTGGLTKKDSGTKQQRIG